MSERRSQDVLVGLGRGERDAVLDHAAAEARRRGCGIHVVHVVHPAAPQGVRHGALAMLDASSARLQESLGPGYRVGTELHHGFVVPLLLAESATAAVLVLGRPHAPSGRAVPAISVAVAGRASVPVVVVPDVDPGRGPASESLVVAAVLRDAGGTPGPPGVVRAARDEAARRGGWLRLVHGGPSAAIGRTPSAAGGEPRAGPGLGPDREGGAETVVSELPGAEAVLAHAADAAIVVVGRPRLREGIASPPGSVSGQLLRRSPCPVMVVEP